MGEVMLERATLILILAAISFTIGHGARLLMRRLPWPAWFAGVCFGFLAFLANRVALAGVAWVIYTVLFGEAPQPVALLALVGFASTPLLLSFVHVTPFFGPGIFFILYLISWIRLTTLTSLALGMDWLGCLGWWAAAWLVVSGTGYALRWLTRNSRWLRWTGILGQARVAPEEILATQPGFSIERRA